MDLIQYHHASCFSPRQSTWLDAIRNGQFTTWPGVTVSAVQRYFTKSIATALGHLDQNRKNVQSTKVLPTDDTTCCKPEPLPNGKRTHCVYAAIEALPTTSGAVASDQTGQFPVTSARGMKYVMVVYDYDSNAIIAEPIINRTAKELLRAYTDIHTFLVQRGLRPQLQRLDNEASNALKTFLHEQEVDFQLVPPGMHRRNAAERAIRTWKNHFIAGLCTTDPHFPLYLWDTLIPQANMTLNLLRTSRINPNLSAYSQLNGNFDFNRTPLAPPGTKIVVHVKPDKRKSWDPHGNTGWYTGPAMEHYRCYRVYVTKTQAYRIADTVEFFPSKVPMPKLSSQDAAQHAARDLIHALQHPAPAAPFHPMGEAQLTALRQLATIFSDALPRVTQTPQTPTPAPPLLAAKVTPLPSQATPDTPLNDMFEKAEHIVKLPDWFANAVIDPTTGKALEYRELITNPATKEVWSRSSANEFGRLAQGVGGRIKGTNTMHFIHRHEVPKNKTPTYARFVCDIRPHKAESERTRLTVGGNLIDYPGDTSAPTADITTFKILVNSVLSTPNAKMCCADVKNFYLNTPMDSPEFMRIPIALVPEEIIKEYDLHSFVHNDYVYVRIDKGMYGLPQAGILANKLLEKRLGKHGYYQCRHTPGLWRHTSRPISFSLVVDDFAIKYVGKEHVNHLLNLLRRDYEAVSVDWEAALYCGITCLWDYDNRICELSMPGYIIAVLKKFLHQWSSRAQHSPHRHNPKQYGVTIQLTDEPDLTALLPLEGIKRIQKIVGTLLYYARAVDSTMLVSLSSLASRQSKATERTNQDIDQLLNYCATHPVAILRFHGSDMLLKIHSDAGYLNESKARSRAGGHFSLGNNPGSPHLDNGPILTPTGILKHVASAASEAEYGGLFVNAKEGTIIRRTLHDMGHPQPATSITTDNSTANGIANDTIKQQRSRAIDMRYHWIRDRIVQGHYLVEWQPGSENKADYYTKHHNGAHHQRMRPKYLHCPPAYANLLPIQSCEGVLNPDYTSSGNPGFRTEPWFDINGLRTPANLLGFKPQRFCRLRLLKTLSITLN
jgi:hypothetical protein